MTPCQKAEEIAERHCIKRHEKPNSIFNGQSQLVSAIEQAIIKARNEAIEECASVVSHFASYIGDSPATIIRAIKTKKGGG